MNVKPLKEFMQVLEEEKVPYTFLFYPDLTSISVHNSKFSLELRAEGDEKDSEGKVVHMPERLMVTGSVSNRYYAEIPNNLEAILNEYKIFKGRMQ